MPQIKRKADKSQPNQGAIGQNAIHSCVRSGGEDEESAKSWQQRPPAGKPGGACQEPSSKSYAKEPDPGCDCVSLHQVALAKSRQHHTEHQFPEPRCRQKECRLWRPRVQI